MWKKILFFCLLSLVTGFVWTQGLSARTWPPGSRVPADSIIAAMRRGEEVIIDSSRIYGKVKVRGTKEEPDTIRSLINIVNSHFHDGLSFLHCNFSEKVYFRGVTFSARVYFGAVNLNREVIFERCSFDGSAFLWATRFDTTAVFSYTSFSGGRFVESSFGGNADFDHTEFVGQADFSNSYFDGRANFRLASFHREALFDSTVFGGGVTFNKASFAGDAVFWSTSFRGDASFIQTALSDDFDLREATFNAQVDLSFARFHKIRVSWRQLNSHLIYNDRSKLTYSEMMNYFEEHRQLDDSDGVYLFLKDGERRSKSTLRRYLEFWLIQQTCAYGIGPFRVLATSGLVIALFAIFYYLTVIRESKRALQAGFKRMSLKAYNALYFSVNTFVIGAPIDWAPEDTDSSKKHYLFRILQTAERTLGWILLVLFVVTLTRKFIR